MGIISKTLPILMKKNDGVPQVKVNHYYLTPITPERSQAITTQSRPRPEASPMRKCNKLSKPRKVNVGFHPGFMQRNWLATIKVWEAGATRQAPTSAHPAEASANQHSVAQSLDIQSPKYCVIFTPTGQICHKEYSIPIMEDCLDDSKKEKEDQEQNKDKDNFSDIEDWDGDLEEQKNTDNQTPQPSPKSTSTSETLTLVMYGSAMCM